MYLFSFVNADVDDYRSERPWIRKQFMFTVTRGKLCDTVITDSYAVTVNKVEVQDR